MILAKLFVLFLLSLICGPLWPVGFVVAILVSWSKGFFDK